MKFSTWLLVFLALMAKSCKGRALTSLFSSDAPESRIQLQSRWTGIWNDTSTLEADLTNFTNSNGILNAAFTNSSTQAGVQEAAPILGVISTNNDDGFKLFESKNMFNKLFTQSLNTSSTLLRRTKRKADLLLHANQGEMFWNNPFQIGDKIFKDVLDKTDEIFKLFAPKKRLPQSFLELEAMTDEEIVVLSYSFVPVMNRTSILFRSLIEGWKATLSDDKIKDRVEAFWSNMRWFFVPDIILNFLLVVLEGTPWIAVPAFVDAWNTNPGGDLRDILVILRKFVEAFQPVS